MKRDFDLVRKILMEIQEIPAGQSYFTFNEFDEYDMAVVNEHLEILIEAGLIEGKVARGYGGIINVTIRGLTWQGHDFLDASKDETIWNKVKTNVLKPTVSITFGLLLEVLKAEAKQKLGLP